MMTREDIELAVLINVATGTLFFVLGLLWPKIRLLNKPLVRWFFGKGAFSEDFGIVHGSIVDSRVLSGKGGEARFVKYFHDGRQIAIVGPWGNIVGDSELRASSYLISALDRYRDSPVAVIDDRSAFSKLNSSSIALGSPSTNELSDWATKQNENVFLEFGQDNGGAFIKAKSSGDLFRGFEHRDGKDLGIVLKIPNSRFKGHYFFLCAGLGDWGTSGAAWYLAHKWRRLPWSRRGFGVVVEVDQLSDTSVREIFRATAG
jgi:hypothetical protein